MREKVHRLHRTDYGSVAITTERGVGFDPLLGEFSTKPLDGHNRITQVDNENGLIIFTISRWTLVFGCGMNG